MRKQERPPIAGLCALCYLSWNALVFCMKCNAGSKASWNVSSEECRQHFLSGVSPSRTVGQVFFIHSWPLPKGILHRFLTLSFKQVSCMMTNCGQLGLSSHQAAYATAQAVTKALRDQCHPISLGNVMCPFKLYGIQWLHSYTILDNIYFEGSRVHKINSIKCKKKYCHKQKLKNQNTKSC